MEANDEVVECELPKLEHPLRYIAWAGETDDEQELEDALLNASETVVDLIARFCGFQEVGESNCGSYTERRFCVDPNIQPRFAQPELFKDFMEFMGCEIEFDNGETIGVNVPVNERFAYEEETLF